MVKTVSSPLQNSVQIASASSYTGPTVACTICSASYAPIQASLAQAPKIALESALMSMCHFCFRCRRPSCPLCWDDLHSICGACDEEVQLPFRKEGAPLPMNSTLLKPNLQRGLVKTPQYPLVCVSPGRFQALVPAAEKALNTDPVDMPAVPPATPTKATKKLAPQQVERKTPTKAAKKLSPQQAERGTLTKATKKLAPQQVERMVPAQEEIPTSPIPSVLTDKPEQRASVARRIERTVTLFLAIVILLIAILIFVAALSTEANTFIAHYLHVDIRKEIEYLLQIIQQYL